MEQPKEIVYAVIKDGEVINIIVADQTFVDQYYPGSIRIDQLPRAPGIGWRVQGGKFIAPPEPEPAPEESEPRTKPWSRRPHPGPEDRKEKKQ